MRKSNSKPVRMPSYVREDVENNAIKKYGYDLAKQKSIADKLVDYALDKKRAEERATELEEKIKKITKGGRLV